MSEKCPKCGSERVSDHQIWWACDSCRFKEGFYQSSECKSREITRLTAELAAANKFAGDMVQERDDWMKTAAAERIKTIAAQCELANLKKQLSLTHIPGKDDDDGEMH